VCYGYDEAGQILTITDARGILYLHNQTGYTDNGARHSMHQGQAHGGT